MSHARSEPKDYRALAPDAYEIVSALGQAAAKAGIDKQLLELIKLRASQINGCGFCVQHHVLLSESLGIPTDKLNLVVVWREAPVFSSRERAALAWTEALTVLTGGVTEEVYAQAKAEFSDRELAYLTSAIASINVPIAGPRRHEKIRLLRSRHKIASRQFQIGTRRASSIFGTLHVRTVLSHHHYSGPGADVRRHGRAHAIG